MKDLNTANVRNDLFDILVRESIYRIYEEFATILLDDKSEGVKKKPYENGRS